MPISQKPPAPAQKASPARKPAQPTGHAITSSRMKIREEAVNGIGQVISLIAVLKGQYADAGAVSDHGPKLAHEGALIAETNEPVAKALDYLTEAGPFMGLVAAALPLGLQLLANHGKIDASRMPIESGIVPPAILEARVKAEIEMAHAEMLAKIKTMQAQIIDVPMPTGERLLCDTC